MRSGTVARLPRRRFVRQLGDAARDLGLRVRWLSGYWIAQLDAADATRHVCGYTFPLNSSAAAQLARDKVATHAVLAAAGVPSVPHLLADSPEAVAGQGFPAVIKPCCGYGGRGLARVRDAAELPAALAGHAETPAVAPWLDITAEYRVVMLDGAALLAYRKVLPAGADGWQHNLTHGAVPRLVPPDGERDVLAAAAMRALGLRFAAVDLVDVAGELSVLEVNGGVTLERFSAFDARHDRLAGTVYREALARCF